MDQPGATLSSDLGNIKLKNVKLKTNDFPIDLTNAKIYKYVIKFDPTDTWTKEKKFLMERFLAKLNTDRKSESFIYDKNKFEIILPNAQPELGSKLLLAFYFRRGRGTKAVDSLGALSQQAKTPGDFFGDVLTSRISSDKVRPVDFHIGNDSVRTCTVYADEQLINLEMLNNKQRQEVLDALDKILRKEAHDTGLTMHGKRVFDMACEPAVSGRMAELRKGVVSDNCTSMVDKSVVRRITPCTGVFLKEMNLAELLAHLRALENSNVEEVNQLLKGIKIKKIHGKQEVVQILGLMVGNAEQETFYWNNHKTTTVSNYMQKGNKAAHKD